MIVGLKTPRFIRRGSLMTSGIVILIKNDKRAVKSVSETRAARLESSGHRFLRHTGALPRQTPPAQTGRRRR